jgi:hypothetical protein
MPKLLALIFIQGQTKYIKINIIKEEEVAKEVEEDIIITIIIFI